MFFDRRFAGVNNSQNFSGRYDLYNTMCDVAEMFHEIK